MVFFALGNNTCRRVVVLKALGESFDADDCEKACDVCLGAQDGELVDGRDGAKLVLEACGRIRRDKPDGSCSITDLMNETNSKKDNGMDRVVRLSFSSAALSICVLLTSFTPSFFLQQAVRSS